MALKKRCLVLLAMAMMCALPAANAVSFFQGFEEDISGWDVFNATFWPERVASGTDGITSASGGYHAVVGASGNAATDWGGYRDVFPPPGYWTRTDIYLDTNQTANDIRFDYFSAISTTAPNHDVRRDFFFHAGFYNDEGGQDRFVISTSAGTLGGGSASGSAPKTGQDPFTITETGWYTFEHLFYDSGSGVLAVDLSIYNAGGGILNTWTLSDPTDIIGSTVGGNWYGWISNDANNGFDVLAFDNTQLAVVPEPGTLALLGLGMAGVAGKVVRRRRRA